MTPELAKWLIGIVITCTVAIGGAVAYLSTVVFKIGQKYGAVETSLTAIQKAGEKIEKHGERLERIPILEMKIDTHANAYAEGQRRFNSIIPPLQEKVTTLWEKVFSLSEWRKSRPNMNGNGHGE